MKYMYVTQIPYVKLKRKALTQSSLYANCFSRKLFSRINVFVRREIVLDQSLTFSGVLDDKIKFHTTQNSFDMPIKSTTGANQKFE